MKKDYLDGDHSFKNWVKIMWKNLYLPLFIVFFSGLVWQIFNIDKCIEAIYSATYDGIPAIILTSLGILLPILGSSIITYKGFYQYWNDLKNGKSR